MYASKHVLIPFHVSATGDVLPCCVDVSWREWDGRFASYTTHSFPDGPLYRYLLYANQP